MKVRQIAALVLTACMPLAFAGCGGAQKNSGSGSDTASVQEGAPSLEQIYAANTLQNYEDAHIQPSITVCLREGPENEETNILLTTYRDAELGLITRIRQTNVPFRYFFTRDDVTYSCEQDEEENTLLTVCVGDTAKPDSSEDGGEESITYPEQLFNRYSFGKYRNRETMLSCTDCGDTYHIVTDISAFSFQDSAGRTFTYTTQEYDVEKETLRIIDTFRTYRFKDTNGAEKVCTRSRCLTYGKQIFSPPEFFMEVRDADWSRRLTLYHADGRKQLIDLPKGIPVGLEAPDGYQCYADRHNETVYSPSADDGEEDLTLYIAEP